MLNGKLGLHDVHDVEKLARRALNDGLRDLGATLRDHDHEDALAYLIATAWELSLRYDPSRKWSFSKLAYRTLRLRIVDFYRQRYGDARRDNDQKRAHRFPVSLDADAGSAGEDGGSVGGERIAVYRGVPPSDSRADDDLRRLELERRGNRARDLEALRDRLCKRAEGRPFRRTA